MPSVSCRCRFPSFCIVCIENASRSRTMFPIVAGIGISNQQMHHGMFPRYKSPGASIWATLAQFTPPNANQTDLAGGCQAFCSRPRERRPLRIFVLGRGDRQVSSQSCAFEFCSRPRERRPLRIFVLGRGDRRVSSQSYAFEFSYSLVSLAAHAVAQRTVCATGFVPMSRRRRVGIVCIAPRHHRSRGLAARRRAAAKSEEPPQPRGPPSASSGLLAARRHHGRRYGPTSRPPPSRATPDVLPTPHRLRALNAP